MSTADLPVHVERCGREPGPDVDTFVLIHGYAASRFSWRSWVPRLADMGHVVSIDMKGFGAAPKPDDGYYAPSDQAALVHRVIERDALQNLTLCGHSLGGGVALLTALRLQDSGSHLSRRLVIVAGAAYEQRLPPFVRLAKWPRLSASFFRILGPDFVVRHVLRTIVHDRAGVTEEQVRGYADPLRSKQAVRALLDSARQIVPLDLADVTARFGEIAVPALLLWGRNDRVVPLAIGERLAAALPDARLHVLEKCGHLPVEERPEEAWAVVEAFLADTSSPDR